MAAARRALGRRPPPESLLRSALRLAPRRERPDLDVLALDLFAAWPRLMSEQGSSVSDPSVIDLLALERRSALTVFVFIGNDQPVLVLKVPRDGATGPVAEAEALRAAGGLAGAPRYLGRCRDAYVQEVIPGAPFPLEPLRPDRASRIRWDERHVRVAEALRALKIGTRTPEAPREAYPTRARVALRHPGLSPETNSAVGASIDAVDALSVSVLKHGDLSPQNCLFQGSRFSGLVDWEGAILRGTPGYDLLNLGVAELEHRLALFGLSPTEYVDAMVRAWSDSEYFTALRSCVASEVEALDLDRSIVPAIEISFFARRLGHRLAEPDRYVLGPDSAAAILEAVVAQGAPTSR